MNNKTLLTAVVLFCWTHYALYQSKKDPGIIAKTKRNALKETFSLDDESSGELSSHSRRSSNQSADQSDAANRNRFGDRDPTHQDVEMGDVPDVSNFVKAPRIEKLRFEWQNAKGADN